LASINPAYPENYSAIQTNVVIVLNKLKYCVVTGVKIARRHEK
jgi:hypothetical protein